MTIGIPRPGLVIIDLEIPTVLGTVTLLMMGVSPVSSLVMLLLTIMVMMLEIPGATLIITTPGAGLTILDQGWQWACPRGQGPATTPPPPPPAPPSETPGQAPDQIHPAPRPGGQDPAVDAAILRAQEALDRTMEEMRAEREA